MAKLFPFYKVRSGGLDFQKNEKGPPQNSLFFYILFIALIFCGLILRLFQLTIVKGNYYQRLSEQNRIRELIIDPRRGSILDRKGMVIAKNEESKTDRNDAHIESGRTYGYSYSIAHLIGYRQTADKNDLKNDNCINPLHLGDKVGKKGVEKLFECDLRGLHGKKLIEVDAKGAYVKTITVQPPKDGKPIQLAFDSVLQEKAYELIKTKNAVVVALKPKTGEVLILTSSPSFDPQDFEDANTSSIRKYFSDPSKPMFNRATEGVYPPGSLFKLTVASGALEEKKITEKTLFEDTGTIKAGPLTFGNWYFLQYGKTEGMVDIVKAIRRSNDIFFYRTGGLLGPEDLKKWAEIFGYGKQTGIGFEEAEGTIPSPFWKEETLKDQWYTGDMYNFSIGQGYLLTTPLQVALASSVFANDGSLCVPQLLKVNDEIKPQCKKLPLSDKTIALIKRGMEEACSPGGTGWPLFDFSVSSTSAKIQTACKTGTAESHSVSGIPHAWFTVYAPSSNPEIALTILIEEGGQGSDVAAPIAKEILKSYFERKE
ncbi:hypothetical protein COT62_01875 [Candidatus Roizmanbacteria bacterium CG09_land_8_20_14_0_10_41_9]|uniref:Penicillin-binding protein 2 n=2 Tax=Bacteria candidate phyla TaxID=1783234 RepID=A0A2H0WSY5_9BACT|nr:MAG: hypothetical protein COT62_01875 [Candidatus Roizmanbacteria bacterium CG09_land_8_20_14_0_10_41_9]